MTYDLWKTRDPNDTGFYDMPEDDGPTELDIAYQRIEELVKALKAIVDSPTITSVCGWYDEIKAARDLVGKVQVP